MLQLAADFSLPQDAVTQALAILGLRGAGKTHTAAVLAEELDAAGQQIIVLDPTGAWWGLRASADGKEAGRQIPILGGDHGDAPLEAAAGGLVAELVVDQRASLVIDCSDFTISEQRRFVADFAERLWTKTARSRQPRHLLIDEADEFIPQRVQADQARMVGGVARLVKRGRIRGLGVTLISQRPASVNKDVLSQVETLVALRMTGSHDVAAVEHWIEHNVRDAARMAEVIGSLATLETGEAWVWSPSWLRTLRRVRFRRRYTFDSSATPTAVDGARAPRRLADVDIGAIRIAMASAVEQARQIDPKVLKARVAELERKLAAAVPVVPVSDALCAARSEAVDLLSGMAKDSLGDVGADVERVAASVAEALCSLQQRVASARQRFLPGGVVATSGNVASNGVRAGILAASRLSVRAGVAGVSAYARQVLQSLANHAPMRPTRSQLALLAGRSGASSAFHAAVAELLRAELIENDRGAFALTSAGIAVAPPEAAGDPVETWRRALPSYERSVFEAVMAAGGPVERGDLAHRAGRSASSSAFHAAVSTLARNGLVEVGGGRVRLSTMLRGQA